ncbi:MAG: hypothetical protein Q3983_04490 [Capnocytophaga sp.]|nr:hypothetical protein [Capnocytophaga sp.]
MRKIYSILAIFCLSILVTISCSKDSGGDTPNTNGNANGGGNTNTTTTTAVTTDFLKGTWAVLEYEQDGTKFSTNTTYAKDWNCIKQEVLSFAETEFVFDLNKYDEDAKVCVAGYLHQTYTLKDNKITLSNKETFQVSKDGDNLHLYFDIEGNKVHYTLKKTSSSVAAPKTATAKISVTNPRNGVTIQYSKQPLKNTQVIFLEEEKELINGKVEFEVTEYIGKKLYFIAKEEGKNVSEQIEKVITAGDNAISITLTEKRETKATISVVKNGIPARGEEVYALNRHDKRTLAALSQSGYTKQKFLSVFSVNKKATTNSQGEVEFVFGDLDLTGDYTFVVLGDEKYYSVDLTVVANASKTATITINSSSNSGSNNSGNNNSGNSNNNSGSNNSGNNNSGQRINFAVIAQEADGTYVTDAVITINGVTKTFLAGADFTAVRGSRVNYSITSECYGQTKTGSFIVDSYVKELKIFDPAKGTLIIENTSKNPYTVTIGNQKFTLEGKSTRTFNVYLGEKYTVHWKQNSGYVFYPTEDSAEVSPTCSNKNIRVTFP